MDTSTPPLPSPARGSDATETRRIAAVRRLGLVGSDEDEQFDRLTRLAARALRVSAAFITLIEEDHQWIQSCSLDDYDRITGRDEAFCDRAIAGDDPILVVHDASRHPVFADYPNVVGEPFIRFYAGRVIRDPHGFAVGTVCVTDDQPREPDAGDLAMLDEIGTLVEQELERRENAAVLRGVDASERIKDLILTTLREGVILRDADGNVIESNPAAERMLGMAVDELPSGWSPGADWPVVHPDGTPWAFDERPSAVALRTGVEVEDELMGLRRPDGSTIWVRVNATPTRTPEGEISGVVEAFDDITTQLDLHMSLQLSEQVSRASLDALEQGVMLTTADGELRRTNPAAERILGRSADELREMLATGRWTVYDADGVEMTDDERPTVRARRTGRPVLGEVVGWRRPDGEMVRLRLSCIPDADADGDTVLAFTDVTAEERMLADLTRFQYLFQNANDIITVVDETGYALYSSPSTERVLGYPPGWHHPGGILAMVHPDDLGIAAAELALLMSGGRGPEPFVVRVQAFDGEWRHVECMGANLLDEPTVRGVVITARDATERVRLTEELAHRAAHDELTGLPNRRVLESALSDGLARAMRDDTRVGVCFIDLDGFKGVNDTLGHGVGDQLLIDAATCITASVREGDVAARVGGDEFVVLLDPVSSDIDSLSVARRIRDSVLSCGSTFSATVGFGASVGLALSEPGDTPAALLRRADDALYRAKATRDSSIAIADGGLDGATLV